MGNNLHRIEKDLRSIAKRYKSVKYSIGLAILFLMLGVSAFSEEVNTKAQVAQIATREELKTSVGDVQTKLNVLRDNNKKEIKNLNLELVQLMEQGTQVVKSPWASWQFGMNFFYENWGGTYKGSGDKPQKYIYNAVHTRGDWKVKNAMDALDARKVSSTPLTPGNDSLASWIDILNTLSGAGKVEKDSALYSSTNGRRTWGLVDLLNIKEPTNEVEILARISPKEVNKQAIPLTIDEPVVEGIEAPKVEPNVNTPLKAPEIKLPEISEIVISSLEINPPEAPNAPTISVSIDAPSAPNAPTAPTVPSIEVTPGTPGTVTAPKISITVTPPTITALTITTPPTVTVTPPTVSTIEPVAFSVAPTIDSKKHKVQKTDQDGINTKFPVGEEKTYTVNDTTKDNSNFFTLNAATGKAVLPKTGTVNVEVNDTRAMVIDEPKNGSEFVMDGTINLYGTKNMGIDLQGSASTQNIVAKIVNSGLIEGHSKDKTGTITNKQQIAFGFSNVDASYNNTMSHIINKGTISLNAPESAAMQLKPEDPHNWTPDWTDLELVGGKYYVKIGANSIPSGTSGKGRVLMKADNQKDININSKGSFGIITVFNPGISTLDSVRMANLSAAQKTNANLRAQRNLAGAQILPGGEIGRSALADSTYTSGVYNTGTININGDESVGVGILHEIQEVKVGGTINIGTGTVNQVKMYLIRNLLQLVTKQK
ncbi:autotransporter-associated N-terminal domain-containing protein [Fusobacterium sp. 27098_8_59]|uniref:autotransporter-associated N-terminal domain-containing protein n=1 Tax=Fusobacterium sp. 27098_8_59 TaxID=3003691 RepID=UPI00352D0BD4